MELKLKLSLNSTEYSQITFSVLLFFLEKKSEVMVVKDQLRIKPLTGSNLVLNIEVLKLEQNCYYSMDFQQLSIFAMPKSKDDYYSDSGFMQEQL